MNVEKARYNMIEQQIRPWNVLDAGVLELLSVVKRENFVPAAYKGLAFADIEVPLSGGQCMLVPRLEARMLQDIALQQRDKVLEIGAGSGFMAALLAQRAQRVISLEINPELAALARANLQKEGVTNVDLRQGDGSKGAAADGPYDAIVLSGSVAQIPQQLLEQLKVGGRLVAVVGDEPAMSGTLVTRTGAKEFKTVTLWETNAPRLQGFTEPDRFQF